MDEKVIKLDTVREVFQEALKVAEKTDDIQQIRKFLRGVLAGMTPPEKMGPRLFYNRED